MPNTVVRWHRRSFALYWRWKSHPRRPGRPAIAADLRDLIRQMQGANPLWGAFRVHVQPRELGLEVTQATVAKVFARCRGMPPLQTWPAFLSSHVAQLASVDFLAFTTATFRALLVFVVLSHDRRRIVHVNVMAQSTAAWTTQQFGEA